MLDHQPVPDSFYYLLFFTALLAAATSRAWHIMLSCLAKRSRSPLDTVYDRITFVVSGFLPSAIAITLLLRQYTPHRVQLGLSYQYHMDHTLGVAAWAIVILHVLTIITMVPFTLWLYSQPPTKKYRERR